MKELSVRDMRANLGRLDELVAAEGELVICRHGRPIARVLPMAQQRQPPTMLICGAVWLPCRRRQLR